jgi:hypothetical protein
LISVITVLKTAWESLFFLPFRPTVETLTLILITPDLNTTSTDLTDLIIHARTNERLYTGAMILIWSF